MKSEFQIDVPKLETKKRLDVFIFEFLESQDSGRYSRSEVQNAIFQGACFVNERAVQKSGLLLKGGEQIQIAIESPSTDILPDAAVKFDVLYEDEVLLVINKPAGLVVHPAPGVKGKTLVHGIVNRIQGNEINESPERPGIVHRLDKDTSGAMVVAKTMKAKRNLQDQLKEPRTMKRVYHAICLGAPKKKSGISLGFDDDQKQIRGTISTSIDRHPYNRIKYTVSDSPNARRAVSHFRVLEVKGSLALIEFTLETGRTHQIRVHAEFAGCPIMGDPVYGAQKSSVPKSLNSSLYTRQMLHARSLSFLHPLSGEVLEFIAPYPDDFRF